MNLMDLVPSNADDFLPTQRLARLADCHRLRSYDLTVARMIAELKTDTTKTDAEKTKWRNYLQAIRRKINRHHHDVHLCWPFSRN